MAYDLKTGQVQDFGIGARFEGMNTGAYDPKFNRIYGLTRARGHFVYYDVATDAKVDKGRINNWDFIRRTLGFDGDGNVYGSYGRGQIFKYDPRTDSITELSAKLHIRQKDILLGRDYDKSETAWRTRNVPYATLSLTFGHDRKLYYAAAGAKFDYGGSAGLAASRLITYDLSSGKIEDLGEMHLSYGRPVIGTNAADTGSDGTIYFVGAVNVKEILGKQNYGEKINGVPYRLALFIYHLKAN